MSIAHKHAYAAGFFDGEGYCTIGRRNCNGYIGHYLRIGVNHVRRAPLDFMASLYGGSVRLDNNPTGNRKPRYVWCISTRKAQAALMQMRPYLVNKVEEAQLCIEFQNRINPGRSTSITEEEATIREAFKQRLMKLNSRG